MKLSEAILLGSTVLTPRAGGQHFASNRSGCALGMAAVARGCSFGPPTRPFHEQDRRTLGTEGVWGNWVLKIVIRPGDCWRFRVPREMRSKDAITHIFDYHVMMKRNWTLDRLAAWVRTVEPGHYNPPGSIDPELLEKASQLLAARRAQVRRDSAVEESQQAADEAVTSLSVRRQTQLRTKTLAGYVLAFGVGTRHPRFNSRSASARCRARPLPTRNSRNDSVIPTKAEWRDLVFSAAFTS
jgi:hypothetical protein